MALPTTDEIKAAGAAASQAATNTGIQQAAAGEVEANAENAQSDQLKAQADELRAQSERQQAALTQARVETEQAFKDAKGQHLTDFWGGSTGKRLFSAIAVGLGGGASVLAHQNGNSTYDILRSQIDDHFKMEKQKIDSAFRFAEEKGKLTNQMRLDYAQQLADLQAKHAAVNAGAAAKIRAISAQSKGRIDSAKADETAANLEKDTIKSLQENETNRAHIGLMKAQTGEENARAQALKEGKARDAEMKIEALVVSDTGGNPLGLASNARQTQAISDQISGTQSYIDKVSALAAHIRQYGYIKNPFSQEAKDRLSMIADVQSAGRQISGIQASDAGQKLEHEMIGGAGVLGHGFTTASPETLMELAKKAQEKTVYKIKSALHPLPKGYKREGSVDTAGIEGGGKGSAPTATATATNTATATATKSVTMPDGTVQVFDSAGKRIK